MTDTPKSPIRTIVRWGIYPASWALLMVGFHQILADGAEPRLIWAQTVGVLLAGYLILEITLPYQRRWSMTWPSLRDDLKYVVLNGTAGAVVSGGLALLAITTAGRSDGLASGWSVWTQVAAALLIFEAINYTIHRSMHEMRGPLGRFLWLSHAAHHLPPRLYLVMHAVFHPLNGALIQAAAIILPIWAMGYSAPAVAIFLMINGMHGLISHFNVDVRLGWASYVFAGTETHRYHHSANREEAMNYGATLMIYDILFGTFVYRPGVPPTDLGVQENAGLPDYGRLWSVLALPFRRLKRG